MKIPEPDHGDVDKLVSMLDEAKKPLILVGGGVIRSKGAVPEFRDFIKTGGRTGRHHRHGRRRLSW